MPFSIGLPPSILDGGSTSISVRIDGSSQEFVGSPLLIRFDTGDGLHDRLTHLEQRNGELEAEVAAIARHPSSPTSPSNSTASSCRGSTRCWRSSAKAWKGQMMALWRELSPEGPAPLMRRPLPESFALSLAKPFTGFRWSEPIVGLPSDRWFAHSGFVATEISNKHDLLLVAQGALAVAAAAWERLTVLANGQQDRRPAPSPTARAGGSSDSCRAPFLSTSGALALVFETPVAGVHTRLAPTATGAVSLSLASVELTGLAASAPVHSPSTSRHVSRSAGIRGRRAPSKASSAGWAPKASWRLMGLPERRAARRHGARADGPWGRTVAR